MRQITIQQNDAGQRLDKFLAKSMPALPKGLMCKFIRTKHIKRNGKRCAISDRLEPGDVLTHSRLRTFSKPLRSWTWCMRIRRC